jgi:UDP:flavonoid glycosyltransferase YjiC (YdhE family)
VSRVLFVVPPLAGHTNPPVGVAAELARRGHDVAWVAHRVAVGHLLPRGAAVYDLGDTFLDEAVGLLADRERARGVGALRFLWERFLAPLATATIAAVDAAVQDFRPDVVVADQQAFAGPVAAGRHGVRWVTSATSPGEFANPLALVPNVARWVHDTRDALLAALDVPADRIGTFDPRFSPDLILLYSTPALTGPIDVPSLHAVGPVLSGRPPEVDFPWEWLEGRPPAVLVSLGTVSSQAGRRFVRNTLDAVARLGLAAVVVAPADVVGPVPANVLRRDMAPIVGLLPHVEAVVCHAGHNTVCEALAHGRPLVVAPIRDDQPIVAGQVVEAGAGMRLPLARATADDVAAALTSVRHDPGYRQAAERVAAAFAAAGGAPLAADLIEEVAARGPAAPETALAATAGTGAGAAGATGAAAAGGGAGGRDR